MSGKVSFWKQAVVSALILGLAVGGWTQRDAIADALALNAEEVEERSRPAKGVPIIAAAVATARDDLSLEVVGTGRALRSVMLRPETDGKIAEFSMNAGRAFKAGDVLLRLENAEQRLLLQLAETRLAEAQRSYERLEQLVARGASTATQLDEAETNAEIARLEVERAREALDDRILRAPFDGVAGLTDM
ncbi:MAG: hypothetical protein AAFU55_14520, partial [Pseudomonadota bacterium]